MLRWEEKRRISGGSRRNIYGYFIFHTHDFSRNIFHKNVASKSYVDLEKKVRKKPHFRTCSAKLDLDVRYELKLN